LTPDRNSGGTLSRRSTTIKRPFPSV
jgi:hypothetical protein